MRPAPSQPRLAQPGAPLLQRSATLAVVVAIHLLLLVLLLRLAPPTFVPMAPTAPISVRLLPNAPVAPQPTRAAKAPRAETRAASRSPAPAPAPAPPVRPPPVPAPDPPDTSIWSKVIPMTRQQMAAGDIARFPSRSAAKGEATAQSGAAFGGDRGDPGPGSGPNGEPLYNAEWYRRPTRAELSFYLPANAPSVGWGMIACQTVAGNRVDNCREIAQSPAGSGLSGAVLKAAWQFRVLPPRIGGRKMIGSWVRIRIDYTVTGAE